MTFFTTVTLNTITLNPETIINYYTSTRTNFLNALPSVFATQCEDHLKLAWCSVLAFELKDYGSSNAKNLKELLSAPVLDCDNYVLLTWHLYNLMRPLSDTKIAALGFDGGVIGNHAQMQAQTTGSPDILLDPTIGLVVFGCNLDALSGTFVYTSAFRASFFSFSPRPAIESFNNTVISAIETTSYKPSDLLYYIKDIGTLMNVPVRSSWLTPRA